MYVRITWAVLEASAVDPAVDNYRDRILPSLRTQAGFLGGVVVLNRETDEAATASYWDTLAALEASRPMSAMAREEVAQRPGVSVKDVDEFEVLLQDRIGAPRAGTFLRANDIRGLPANVDAVPGVMRDSGLPAVKALPGYRGLTVAANRQTGRVIISSAWDTAADRGGTDKGAELRSRIAQVAGATEVRVTLAESLVTELSPAIQSASPAAANPS